MPADAVSYIGGVVYMYSVRYMCSVYTNVETHQHLRRARTVAAASKGRSKPAESE